MVHGWIKRYPKVLIKQKRGGIHQSFYGTWLVDFILRQDALAGKFMLGRFLSDKKFSG